MVGKFSAYLTAIMAYCCLTWQGDTILYMTHEALEYLHDFFVQFICFGPKFLLFQSCRPFVVPNT